MDATEFMEELRREFPELVEELDDETWRGLLHLETGCFARLTQKAIDTNDRALVKRSFEFARRSWLAGDDDVQNALGVSFVENLNFNDGKVPRAWAFNLLARPLQEGGVALGTAPKDWRG